MSPSVTVVDPGIPQLMRLAGGLASQGMLRYYVCGFRVMSGKARFLGRVPAVGRLVRRRLLPPGIPPQLVQSAGLLDDVMRALYSRAPGALRVPPVLWA
jgi:hypothetical protein